MADLPPEVSPQTLDDQDLACWLGERLKTDQTVGYVHAQYACKVFVQAARSATLYPADPGTKSRALLKRLARRNLLERIELTLDDLLLAHCADKTWALTPATAGEIGELLDDRLRLLGRGRGADIRTATAWRVWTDAGGRCMFEGCGENLGSIPLYNKTARVGYLAHIVASDPNGPRGEADRSHKLSDCAENIMLMCDAHHRLIDSFAPERYSASALDEMRQTHVMLVDRYLAALAYPRITAATLHADLANVPTYFHDSELTDALLATGRAMQPRVLHFIRRRQRDDRRTPDFWWAYLHDHEQDIRDLVRHFNNLKTGDPKELAMFPLHHVATTVLAGRIVGEAQAVRVFQYHRERRSWQWEEQATPQPDGTFNAEGLVERKAAEALITIELTANLDEEALPAQLAESVATGTVPWVRVVAQQPSGGCIRHPDDLDQFMRAARRAINHVQDRMRVRRVHLIAMSPASGLFCFGQMLQAGHHPTYTVYDRACRDTPFSPAFSITGHDVRMTYGAETRSISLR